MYTNQIDDIIDKILDNFYLDRLIQDPTFHIIINEKKHNFVEYHQQLNNLIKSYVDSIDTAGIQKLITDKKNLQQIMDIVKRYITYYCFLYLAYYYDGNIKEFRNNLIQFSKLQETSKFHVKNFFDTENNYQVIRFFKIIKDSKNILLMTPLQQKNINMEEMHDAVMFLKSLGKEYMDNFLLQIVTTKGTKGTKGSESESVEVNVHNLIKTIVFGEVYKNQERPTVFKILTEIEESETEYTYIDIVVSVEETSDFDLFQNIFAGKDRMDFLAQSLWELVNAPLDIKLENPDTKNNLLLQFRGVTSIVDDFLRYHRDSERINIEQDKSLTVPIGKDNARNIRFALMKQTKNKKENTKAQLIVNKVDVISEFYSPSVKQSPELYKEIKSFFQGPLAYRKAVLHNYLSEVYVMRKMQLQGKKVTESNEYYLELKYINQHAYFNFKDFQKYGTSVVRNAIDTNNITSNISPINTLRYSNIEFIDQHVLEEIDLRVIGQDDAVNITGLAFGPLIHGPLQCVTKENLIDIRNVNIIYYEEDKKELKTNNGYEAFLKIIKHYYIGIIKLRTDPFLQLYLDINEVRKINPSILNKIIYWIYDVEQDKYDVTTYENIKSYNFQDKIKYMNANLADEINKMLRDKLIDLIRSNITLGSLQIDHLIELFIRTYRLSISPREKKKLFISEYLLRKPVLEPAIILVSDADRSKLPVYTQLKKITIYNVKIDMVNPTHPQLYIKPIITAEEKGPEVSGAKIEIRCRHEESWESVEKLKKVDLNKYNMAITQFIYEYANETTDGFFVCRVCSQLLSMREYVQDGKFDNSTEKYTTNYVPINIPLHEIKEYAKFTMAIKYVEGLLKKMNDFSKANMLVGDHPNMRVKRKTFVKNIIDIVDHHNNQNLNMKNRIDTDTFYKMFGIDKSITSVFFFEFSDKIFNFSTEAGITTETVEINRLKLNNVVLYFLWVWISELNESQIILMNIDKIINIYSFEKHGKKLFEGLLLKKNINGKETVPILSYPILCYIIFVASYYFMKYGIWYYVSKTKTLNQFNIKVIAHSLVELFNGFALKLNEMPNDYIYTVAMNKLYTHLNTIYKNSDIIDLLKKTQSRYGDHVAPIEPVLGEKAKSKSTAELPVTKIGPVRRKLPTYRIGTGLMYDQLKEKAYHIISINTLVTNCPTGDFKGDFHNWTTRDTDIVCSKCGTVGKDIDLNNLTDLTDLSFYFNLAKIAQRRCIDCQAHEYIATKSGEVKCTLCNKTKLSEYTEKELDKLSLNINEASTTKMLKQIADVDKINLEIEDFDKKALDIMTQLIKSSKKITESVGVFINKLESFLDKNINLSTEANPSYLKDDVYVINHIYNGLPLETPVIFIQKDNKVQFKENQTFFKKDVFFYTSTSTGLIDVFYDAVTLQLIGYKENHKEYVTINKSANYLKIDQSVTNKFLNLGYEHSYINLSLGGATLTEENKSQTLTSLVKIHIQTIKMIIDKISSIISKIKNFQPEREEMGVPFLSPDNKRVKLFVQKYANLLPNIQTGSSNTAFDDWNYIRDMFSYKKINWSKADIQFTDQTFIKSSSLNYYSDACDYMISFLVKQLIDILDSNPEKKDKKNIAMMYVELLAYIFELYNLDMTKNKHAVKRFEYILSGSEFMINLTKKGLGIISMEEILEKEFGPPEELLPEIVSEPEQTEEEHEDAVYESEALDMETPYYMEEDEDYDVEPYEPE